MLIWLSYSSKYFHNSSAYISYIFPSSSILLASHNIVNISSLVCINPRFTILIVHHHGDDSSDCFNWSWKSIKRDIEKSHLYFLLISLIMISAIKKRSCSSNNVCLYPVLSRSHVVSFLRTLFIIVSIYELKIQRDSFPFIRSSTLFSK